MILPGTGIVLLGSSGRRSFGSVPSSPSALDTKVVIMLVAVPFRLETKTSSEATTFCNDK